MRALYALQPSHSSDVVLFALKNDRHDKAEDKSRQGDPAYLISGSSNRMGQRTLYAKPLERTLPWIGKVRLQSITAIIDCTFSLLATRAMCFARSDLFDHLVLISIKKSQQAQQS